MARTHINFRTGSALVLLGVLIAVFASLGNWQLNRAAQRDAIRERIAAATTQPQLELRTDTPSAELVPWRGATAHGRWLHDDTVLIENRNHEGRPGYWVATPLQLATPDGSPQDKAVLVLRGWLAREDVIQTVSGKPELRPDIGNWLADESAYGLADNNPVHSVSGELLSHVPRMLELWSWSDQDSTSLSHQLSDARHPLPVVQNLDLTEYGHAIAVDLLPTVLARTDARGTMVQDWPRPSIDADTNRGYAMQWFSFCAIAAGAFVVIGWRAIRRTRGQS